MKEGDDMTIRQAAKVLGLKVRTIRGWCITGKIRAERVGKYWIIPEEEIYSVRVQAYASKGREHSRQLRKVGAKND